MSNTVAMEQINKLIPKQRFPEFVNDGEWKHESINSTCEVLNNRRKPITGSERTKGIYPYYGASGIIDYIDNYIFEEKLLLVGEDGAKWGAYENTAFIVDGKYWVNNHAHVLKPISINHKLLESYLVKLDIHSFITGAAPPKLTLGKLKEIPIPVPKNPREQEKIADCLTSLDEVITAHQDKLETLKNHKKGLLQNLFPQEGQKVPNYRFPEFVNDGEWKEKELGDKEVAFIVNEKVSVNNLQIENYISTENMLPNFNGVSIASKLPSSGKFTYFKIGDILISNIRPYLKKVWKSNKTGGVSNDVFVFRAGSDSHSNFLEFILKNDAFINYVMKSAKGVKMPRGDRESILKYKVSIPSKFEQQKIAECLMEVDNLINAQIEKIEQLNTHKKGLMQGLFPKVKN